jgi:hypothetical protein
MKLYINFLDTLLKKKLSKHGSNKVANIPIRTGDYARVIFVVSKWNHFERTVPPTLAEVFTTRFLFYGATSKTLPQ